VDLVEPLVCFECQPFIPARITSAVATEESVAHDNVVGVNQAMKNGMGCRQVAWGGDEDAFAGVEVTATDFVPFSDRQRTVSVFEASHMHCHHLQTRRGGDS